MLDLLIESVILVERVTENQPSLADVNHSPGGQKECHRNDHHWEHSRHQTNRWARWCFITFFPCK